MHHLSIIDDVILLIDQRESKPFGMASAPDTEIDPLVKQFQTLQEQTQALASGRQNFLSRLNENKMVAEELGRMEVDSNVFKLIGPVLVKQDLEDAKATVDSRLELIQRELCVHNLCGAIYRTPCDHLSDC